MGNPIHIFNGVSNLLAEQARNARPFLINGFNKTIIATSPFNGEPIYYDEPTEYFTVDKQGFVGINYLDPLSKLHLHNGVFTISHGRLDGLLRWEIHGTQNAFAIKDFDANAYRFWISKESGYVGIGNTDPQEKLHVRGGNLRIQTDYGSTTIGALNASFAHFKTTLPKFYFDKSLWIKGALSSYNMDLELQTHGATKMTVKTNGQVDIGDENIST